MFFYDFVYEPDREMYMCEECGQECSVWLADTGVDHMDNTKELLSVCCDSPVESPWE